MLLITEMVFTGGQSGPGFLFAVRDQHPDTVRIILSGYVDRDITLQTVDLAHQFLAKPCDDDDLKRTISKAFLMRDLLSHEPLKQLAARIDSLPSLPTLYAELVKALDSEDSSIQEIGDIISKDPGLTAKILKMVNSSFFGVLQRVSNPAKAVNLLGLDLVQTIVLASGTFEKFNKLKLKGVSIERMWDHAMATALLAKTIAQEARLDRSDVDTAFMSGLLHDIGKLLIAANMPDEYQSVTDHMSANGCSMASSENQIIGTTHAAIGAYLLGLWGLPDPIIEAVAPPTTTIQDRHPQSVSMPVLLPISPMPLPMPAVIWVIQEICQGIWMDSIGRLSSVSALWIQFLHGKSSVPRRWATRLYSGSGPPTRCRYVRHCAFPQVADLSSDGHSISAVADRLPFQGVPGNESDGFRLYTHTFMVYRGRPNQEFDTLS